MRRMADPSPPVFTAEEHAQLARRCAELEFRLARAYDVIDQAANLLHSAFKANRADMAHINAEVRRLLRSEVPAPGSKKS